MSIKQGQDHIAAQIVFALVNASVCWYTVWLCFRDCEEERLMLKCLVHSAQEQEAKTLKSLTNTQVRRQRAHKQTRAHVASHTPCTQAVPHALTHPHTDTQANTHAQARKHTVTQAQTHSRTTNNCCRHAQTYKQLERVSRGLSATFESVSHEIHLDQFGQAFRKLKLKADVFNKVFPGILEQNKSRLYPVL